MKELTLERVIANNIIKAIKECNDKREIVGLEYIAEDYSNEVILDILTKYFFRQRRMGIDIDSVEFLEMMFPHYFSDIIAAEAGFYPDQDIAN